MASPTTTTIPQSLTGDPLIDAAITGYRWNLGADRTIDWSISNGFIGEFWINPASVKEHVEYALQLVSYYANVRFNYVGFFATPAIAVSAGSEINVSVSADRQLFTSNGIWAWGYFPRTSYGGWAGDVLININSQANSLASYEPGSAGFALLLHELGHALGLKHPHDDGGTGHPTLTSLGAAELDYDWFSVMSYEDEFQWNLISWDPASPMVMDALAYQYLYGKNLSTNAGDSIFRLSADGFYLSIWDASGNDTVSAEQSTTGWSIVLPDEVLSRLVDTKVGVAFPTNEAHLAAPHTLRWLLGDLENVVGSPYADVIEGNRFDNQLMGLGGADQIDGGAGFDTAVFRAASTNYTWSLNTDGSWKVVDRRLGSPDGTETLYHIEALKFTDRTVALTASSPGAAERILRGAAGAGTVAELVQLADATTSVATLAYQFFTGKIPSEAGIDYLVSPIGPNPNNLNSAYYQNFNLENRYINFAVNLGKLGEGAASFKAAYGARTMLDTMKAAYQTIFGSAPSDAKAHALLDPRADYFAYYGGDGPSGIGTKAAAVGWLLAEAAKADVGTMQTANIAFLTDLADGAAFAVNIVGVYGGTVFAG
jgi:serralysin